MKFTLICNLLLFAACYKLFGNWEIPINLWFNPFRVVGGFPTLIDSFVENFFEKTAEASKFSNFLLEDLQYPVLSSKFRRKFNWSCPILESLNQCFTIVTSSECLETSQLSYNFWEHQDDLIECFHVSKGSIECIKSFQRGITCENVVTRIGRSGNNVTFIELDDILINTQVVQKYAEKSEFGVSQIPQNTSEVTSSFCKNYSIHETILVGGENDTNIFAVLPFGINSTNLLKTMECLPPFPSDIFICNCRNSPICQVPILYPTPNSTFCGSTTVSIYHSRGFIYSAIVASSTSESTDLEPQKHTIIFFDLPQTPPRSKFELQRGRFHCPSETTCITEIFYPFNFLDSLERPYQIGILVFSALIGLVILSKTNNE